MSRVGQNHTYIWFIYGIYGREITNCTVIYGVYLRFWPTLYMLAVLLKWCTDVTISTHLLTISTWMHMSRVGQNHTYICCIHGIYGREITNCTVIYGVYMRFWPTLYMLAVLLKWCTDVTISTHLLTISTWMHMSRVGQNHTYICSIHGIYGREITNCTVIYGVYIRFWPTLLMPCLQLLLLCTPLCVLCTPLCVLLMLFIKASVMQQPQC